MTDDCFHTRINNNIRTGENCTNYLIYHHWHTWRFMAAHKKEKKIWVLHTHNTILYIIHRLLHLIFRLVVHLPERRILKAPETAYTRSSTRICCSQCNILVRSGWTLENSESFLIEYLLFLHHLFSYNKNYYRHREYAMRYTLTWRIQQRYPDLSNIACTSIILYTYLYKNMCCVSL